MEILQKVMDFNDFGRYISLNSIENQLRYPSSHTYYYYCVMLFLFSEAKDDGVREQITPCSIRKTYCTQTTSGKS